MTLLKLNMREKTGKNDANRLRREGIVPGVAYKRGMETIHLTVLEKELIKVYGEMGTSAIFKAELDGKEHMALFKEIQRNPLNNHILHFDLLLVEMDEKLKVMVPIILEGREDIAVQPSNLIQVLDEIEVECLPMDLPNEAIVNVVDMQIGDVLEVKDLDVAKDEKVNILTELDETVATLQDIEDVSEVLDSEVEDVDAAAVPTVDEVEEAEA